MEISNTVISPGRPYELMADATHATHATYVDHHSTDSDRRKPWRISLDLKMQAFQACKSSLAGGSGKIIVHNHSDLRK